MQMMALIGLLLVGAGWMLWWVFVLFRFRHLWKSTNHPNPTRSAPAVSVVIAAKNEATNLRKNLPQLLEQAHPAYEIIVVNDHSTDNTLVVLDSIVDSRLKVHTLPEDMAGKKAALTYGIGKAQHDLLLFTDADCWPHSEHWMSIMAAALSETDVVIGYSPMHHESGVLNSWVRYETWITGLLYLSAAAANRPYMAVGRNMGYKKALFTDQGGFRHEQIVSGDDDLFIQQLSGQVAVAPVWDSNTWMWSEAPASWRQWRKQKQRHLSTGWHYSRYDLFWLGMWSMSYLLHVLGVVVLFAIGQWHLALLAMLIRGVGQIAIFEGSRNQLGEQGLRKWVILLDILYCLYIVFGTSILALKRPSKWM